jgi:methyltransferase (TIGR00027 family)
MMRASDPLRRRFLRALALGAGCAAWPGSGALALEAGQPSRTARAAAMQRAAHQLLESPRVFEDPLALRILGAEGVRWLGHNLDSYRGAHSRAMRAFLVTRSRYAEDQLAQAYARGVRQYVVLGAGLDSFAYRNPHRDLNVFEVDHPATQGWKRARLSEQSIEIPATTIYAAVDFETQTLAAGLAAAFRADQPAFFSWLGVTIYLTREAVAGTLAYIAERPEGSQVVFDFAPPPESLNDAERHSHERAAAGVARAGEPWIGYFEPAQLSEELRGRGYSSAPVLAAEDLNPLYFKDRQDGFRLYGSGRIMSALV